MHTVKTKDVVLLAFKDLEDITKNQIGIKIKVLRINNGLEFLSKEFVKFYVLNGIIRHKIVLYSP